MDILIGCGLALWLGVLTAISPCPLATNVAAVSFLSKKIIHPALVLISGFAYALGRMVAYAALGWIIISSLLSVPQVAQFLQKYMVSALGPILIITGLFLLEIFTIHLSNWALPEKYRNKFTEAGAPGAFLLGLIFALAFCPVSAALFFGSLIPLAFNSKMGVLLPFIYGVGTGLPVIIFAVAIALGVTSLSHWFNQLTKLERYTRRITGIIFILAGLYYVGIGVLRLFKSV
ncbi:MAG: aromatic aminobenezylarsenical efflux permease ArsG family transporter [Candidatus Omnitrophica bacterium]|nr:aromatic aminobenezylarsenical efflux permease ArsG family transporter [Candidatus Omnitrophota bacterium]